MRYAGALVAVAAIVGASTAAEAGNPARHLIPLVSHWSGAYVGAEVGYGWTNFSDPIYDWYGGSASGAALGATLGYNFELMRMVVAGIEAEGVWDGQGGSTTRWTSSLAVNWDASLRARLGVDLGMFMPYVTGGLAAMGGQESWGGGSSGAITQTGWTVGAGVEMAVLGPLTTKVEYRYSDYGSAQWGYVLHPTTSTVRVGLNFHF